MPLQVKKLDPKAIIPTVANPGEDLGYDLYALEDTPLLPMKQTLVRTGIAAAFITCFDKVGLLIRDRSSMASRGIVTSGGVIDAGYRGEIKVIMTLQDMRIKSDYLIRAGDKIAQMIPLRVMTGYVEAVKDLPEGARGANGFGSTGK